MPKSLRAAIFSPALPRCEPLEHVFIKFEPANRTHPVTLLAGAVLGLTSACAIVKADCLYAKEA